MKMDCVGLLALVARVAPELLLRESSRIGKQPAIRLDTRKPVATGALPVGIFADDQIDDSFWGRKQRRLCLKRRSSGAERRSRWNFWARRLAPEGARAKSRQGLCLGQPEPPMDAATVSATPFRASLELWTHCLPRRPDSLLVP